MKYIGYLVEFQFLGFRYHGWQKQPDVKTVQGMVDRTLRYVLEHDGFKTLGASRTDAMVSANHGAFELFVKEPLDTGWLLDALNENLPQDIRVLGINAVGPEFNVIQSPKAKVYHYLFAYGDKPHPFCAPLMASFQGTLDIPLMQQGAACFEGEHNFQRFCWKPSPVTQLTRTVDICRVIKNEQITASFFPPETYLLEIGATGFLRHQVRLIMGALVALGRGTLTKADIEQALAAGGEDPLAPMSPASGLLLHRIDYF